RGRTDMRRVVGALVVGALAVWGTAMPAQSVDLIPWAYAIVPPPPPDAPKPVPAARPEGLLSLPGSDVKMTAAQIFDGYNAADWWPNDHPVMPAIVKNGRKPEIRACGLCHYPNGKGKPDNAAVSGLPEVYFIQQMLDYR